MSKIKSPITQMKFTDYTVKVRGTHGVLRTDKNQSLNHFHSDVSSRQAHSPVIVGLTGGISSGKSVVVNEFKKLGAKIIDADKIAHQVLKQNEKVKKEVICFFGKKVQKKNGEIDRKKLGKIIFANKKKRKILEKIIHPVIIGEIKAKLNHLITYSPNHPIFLDVPLLFEAGITNLVDKIIVVSAPKKVQLKRLRERNKLTQKEAEQRISSQWDIKKKIKFADFVIDNTKSLTSLRKQVKQIWNELRQKFF